MSRVSGPTQDGDRASAPQGWVRLCPVEGLRAGEPNFIEAASRSWCVVPASDGSVTVLDDICPHAGASLAGGHIEEGCVVCPWHAWRFSLEDGRNPDSPIVFVRRYEATIREGWVCIRTGSAGQR